MNTTKLKEYIFSEIKSLCDKVYFEDADPSIHPYVVYSLSLVKLGDYRNYMLEINAYDIKTDTTSIETLADNIEDLFDKATHIDEYQQIYTNVANRNSIELGDGIKRRRILIDLKYHGRGN